MSLTLFLRAPEGIVMAADSRVTEGYTLEGPKTRDDSVKFIQLDKDAGVMTHGLYDIGSRGINALKKYIDNSGSKSLPVAETVNEGKRIFSQISAEWTVNNSATTRRDNDVGFVIGSHDRKELSFKVYCLESPEFNPRLIAGNLFLAGQWQIARFLLTKFNFSKTSISALKKMAAISIFATASIDKTVGIPVRMATITGEQGFQWVQDREMELLSKYNGAFSDFFQQQLSSSLSASLDTGEGGYVKG